MKKILFVIYSLKAAGAERVLVDLVNNLDKNKYDITIQTLMHDPALLSELDKRVRYKTIIRIKNRKLRKLFSGIFQYIIPQSVVYNCWVKDSYDTEVAYMEAYPTKILASSSNKKARKLAWVHIDMIKYTRQDHLFITKKKQIKCYEKFEHIFCVSKEVREAFVKKIGLADKVSVMYNVLDEVLIRERQETEGFDEKKECFRMISVGRLCKQKGYERLINIGEQLKISGYEFEILIVGAGEEEERLERIIKDKRLEGQVKLLGYQKNPYSYMASSDLFVCSSYAEGFSTVVCEAILVGLPVITTRCAGMEEILGKSEFGIITENSEVALLKGITEVLDNPEKYCYYKEKTLERQKFFEKAKRLKDYETVL